MTDFAARKTRAVRGVLAGSRGAMVAVATLAFCLSGCGEPSAPANGEYVPEFIVVRRPWLVGERDSVVARAIRTRQLSMPLVGDISDMAPEIFGLDSVDRIVANPAWHGRVSGAAPGLWASVSGVQVPGAGWTTFGLNLFTVNNRSSPPDTIGWLGFMWLNDADSTWKGLAFGATQGTNLGTTTVNTVAFDASGGLAGAGAGEARASNGTYWEARGSGTPNTMSAGGSFYGAASTVTSGPWTGGTQANGIMFTPRINGVGMVRVLGSGAPATQTASLGGFLLGTTRIICVFPSPCTSAAAAAMHASQSRARASAAMAARGGPPQ